MREKVYDREDEYPDDVQEVPEQAEARKLGDNKRTEAPKPNLHDGHNHPEEADGDVEAVGADEREVRRKEGASRPAVTFHSELREFIELKHKEREPEQERYREPKHRLALFF